MKTTKSTKLAALTTEFLAAPAENLERAILRELNNQLRRDDFAPIRGAFIEWDCVEHGAVHVFYADGQGVLEISPKSGIAAAL